MCGISLLIQHITLQNIELLITSQKPGTQQSLGDLKSYLYRRGPDSYKTHSINIKNNNDDKDSNPMILSLTGAVLHLRGLQINAQPLTNNDGNVLLWNGEVFDGLDLKEDENDTIKVFKLLNNENNELSVFEVHKIEGPFAFIYYHYKTNKIWFGRDCLGRRSLLFGYNEKTQCFALSSIPYQSDMIQCNDWKELPNSGIFCLDLNESKFIHYSWREILNYKKIKINPQIDENKNNDDDDDEQKQKIIEDESPLIYSKLNIRSLFKYDEKQNKKDGKGKINIIKLLSSVSYDDIINAFLNVLCNAIKKRVIIPKSSKLLRHKYLINSPKQWIDTIYCNDDNIDNLNKQWIKQQDKEYILSESSIGILYSGGIDSQILAALCDKFIPENESIDLINVVCGDDTMLSPDRLTAINGLLELKKYINPNRKWRLIKVNISYQEICNAKQHILSLIYPCSTIMDFNIGNILWFGSRGIGYVDIKDNYKWIKNNQLIRYSHIDLQLKQKYDDKVNNMDIDGIVSKQIEMEFNRNNNNNDNDNNDDNDDDLVKNKKKNKKNAVKQKKYMIHKQKKKRAKEIKREILDKIKDEIYGENENKNDNDNDDESSSLDELYISSSRVLLLGFGSDELLGGYGRHRTSFKIGGINGLKHELNKDFNRLWKRNLGRDDRLISDNSRESRWPFLDKQFISFIKQLPLKYICNLNQSIGIGDKKILRDSAKKIGLKYSWSLVKRAIQFGSRIANNKVAGYVDINHELNVNDLINYQIYNNNNNNEVNTKVTKKYNKKNGKTGYQ